MCGIFGVIAKKVNFDEKFLGELLKKLAIYSETRGKESAGFCFRDEQNSAIRIIKGAEIASEIINKDVFKKDLSVSLKNDIFCAIGHSRLVTNGSQLNDDNNQPIFKDGIAGVHNGIIVNEKELWHKFNSLKRLYEIDTEVYFSLIRYFMNESGQLESSVINALNEVYGTVSSLMLFDDVKKLAAVTNNGSLFYICIKSEGLYLFASEKFILQEVVDKFDLIGKFGNFEIKQLFKGQGISVDLTSLDLVEIKSNSDEKISFVEKLKPIITTVKGKEIQRSSLVDLFEIKANPEANKEAEMLEFNIDEISKLKRCTKCLLPETFPFIDFDDKGECNYCRNYKRKNQPKPLEDLFKLVEPYKSKDGSADCIIPFSGGRDSTFVLHFVKEVLKLNPIAFTYDWGMVTDLGRRNIARVCGKLGVENIIVSADINWKRENIRKNVEAWLENPHLGMIPLFMAGDKYFFYYTNQVKKQTGIKLNIWGINTLENTDFKVGFGGITPKYNKKSIYSLEVFDQLKLFTFIGKQCAQNPLYLNSSIFDTFGSFFVRYISPKKDYFHLFDYIQWNEKEIEDLIFNEFKWEIAEDTKSTWRIGDGTASFYNYIYYTIAGFSEIDTFRSNQIREGMITRDEGLKLIEAENHPRYESLKWYLNIIGLDYKSVIEKINKIPKLYRVKR